MRIVLFVAFMVALFLTQSSWAQAIKFGGASPSSAPSVSVTPRTFLHRNGGPGDRSGMGTGDFGYGGGAVGGIPPVDTSYTGGSNYYYLPYTVWYPPAPVAVVPPPAPVPFELCVHRDGQKTCTWHNKE